MSKNESQQQQHPMVAVPDAIRTVLRETALVIVKQQQKQLKQQQETEQKSVHLSNNSECWKQLHTQVLAQDIYASKVGYPPYNASIMDGYAIQTIDGDGDANDGKVSSFEREHHAYSKWTHSVVDKVFAGDLNVLQRVGNDKKQQDNEQQQLPSALYVTTGAIVPDPYNCVVPIEECVVEDTSKSNKRIQIASNTSYKKGKWIRPIGCDIPPRSLVLQKGKRLDPVSIGLIYQSGVDQVEIFQNHPTTTKKKITIGVLSTGNELLQFPSQSTAQEGQIPDVNRPILLSLLSSMMSEQHHQQQLVELDVIDLGMARDDDAESLTQTLRDASLKCNIIITTGGISMGESDIMEHVLTQNLHAKLHFGRLHMKPGKPTTFCTLPTPTTNCLVFAMPGNPVSACVCTHLLVQPCVRFLLMNHNSNHDDPDIHGESVDDMVDRMIDNANVLHSEEQVVLTHDIKLDFERPEYHRVRLSRHRRTNEQDKRTKMWIWEAASTGTQRSSRLMSMLQADGLLVLPQGTDQKQKALKGEIYTVLRLLHNNGSNGSGDITIQNSKHLGSTSATMPKTHHKEFTAHIVTILPPSITNGKITAANTHIPERVETSLSGTRSGTVKTVKETILSFVHDEYDEKWNSLVESIQPTTGNDVVDFTILVVVDNDSNDCNLTFTLDLSSKLRSSPLLTKINDTLALQARRGAASQNSTCGLFEVLVGYIVRDQQQQQEGQRSTPGSILLMVPESGLEGALTNVRGLLKHALKVARGNNHYHQDK